MDLIAKTDDTVIGRIDWEQFVEMKEQNAPSAIKFYNKIMRHKSYQLIYEKKNNTRYFTDRMEK